MWGKHEENYKGFVAAMEDLAFGSRTYYGEVSAQGARLYLLEKVPAKGYLQVTYSLYYFAFERDFDANMDKFITDLSKIFLDIHINLGYVNHELSRVLKLARYCDFVSTPTGQEGKIEWDC